MKTVYSSDMVCHLWANRHETETRTSSRNLYVERGALFSYGAHFVIGAFMLEPKSGAPFILWNDAKTSNTTNRHRSQAFRALSQTQRAELVRVSVTVKNSHLYGSGVSELARDCLKAAAVPLAKCEKARERFAGYIAEARADIEAARRLFEYVGDLKAARAVPVLPESATRAEAAEVLRTLAKAEILKRAAEAEAEAVRGLELAQAEAAEYGRQPWATAQTIGRNAARAVRRVQAAREEYKRAAVSVPRKLAKIEAEARAIVAKFEAPAQAEADAETRQRVRYRVHELVRGLGEYANGKRHGDENEKRQTQRAATYAFSRLREESRFIFDRIAEPETVARVFPDETERAELVRIYNRAERIDEVSCLRGQMAHLSESVREHETRTARGFEPASASTVRQRLRFPRFPAFWREKGETLAAQADAVRAEWFKREAERNAETVARWRAGEAVRLPNGLPTMARIRGDIVETSRGATVPLSHAVRLVKLARAIAARGGETFTSADAPRVGHFRVESIAADLSAVIGCHEFTSTEAARICAEIENHVQACAV